MVLQGTIPRSLNDPDGIKIKTATYINISCTGFFLAEIISKIIVNGLLTNGPDSFLHSFINIVVILSTILTIIEFAVRTENHILSQVFKFIKICRVIRLVNMNKGFRLRASAITHGFPKIIQTLFIIIIFIFIFGIIGVQLFKELFYHPGLTTV